MATNEKYVNYYIEMLTSTLNDCVIKNISMMANAKINDEVLQEQINKVEKLSGLLKDQEDTIKLLKEEQTKRENDFNISLKNKNNERDVELTRLMNMINELNNKYRDYDSIKSQVSHVDTFKNELIKTRSEKDSIKTELEKRIQDLISENNSKIEELNSKNKKEIENLNSSNQSEISNLKNNYDETISQLNKKIEELNSKIDYLQLPPAKRKKIDELNKETLTTLTEVSVVDKSLVEDGGTF